MTYHRTGHQRAARKNQRNLMETAMTGTAAGLDLIPDGDDYILKVKGKSKVRLTADQVLILAQSAQSLMGRILARRNPATAGAEAVLVTPVAQIELNEDLLTQEIFLTLIDPNGGRLTWSLPIPLAENLIERLPKRLAELKNKPQTEH
jgi:hypothetical protein